jgi:hypothetical protein
MPPTKLQFSFKYFTFLRFRSFTLPWRSLKDQWLWYLIWYTNLWYKNHTLHHQTTYWWAFFLVPMSHTFFTSCVWESAPLFKDSPKFSHLFYNSEPLNTWQTILVTLQTSTWGTLSCPLLQSQKTLNFNFKLPNS